MTKIVEDVARALHSKNRDYGPDDDRKFSTTWEELTDREREIMGEYAIVAIRAMRIPMETMEVAGQVEYIGVDTGAIWRAMIDEALK